MERLNELKKTHPWAKYVLFSVSDYQETFAGLTPGVFPGLESIIRLGAPSK